jgi:hypothetical protein
MEKRSHPRVQLPLLVELQHPALGKRRCTARDISEGGLFVSVTDHPITNGAKLKLTLLNPNQVDHQPTPTVDMQVTRVEEAGLGLRFVNKTSQHLWQSVKRLREELQIGRDYFQVYVAALAMNEDGKLLIVQEHGRWTFPGHYLIVGEDWREALNSTLAKSFALKTAHVQRICDMSSSRNHDLPEAAAMKLHVQLAVDDSNFAVSEESEYRGHRWIDRRRDIEELTFSDNLERDLAIDALDWYQS